MDSYFLWIMTISLMFASSHCYSESMSCSSVNGQTVCEKQTGSTNTAGAYSGAFSDGRTFRGFGVPRFYPNSNTGRMPGFSHLMGGTGASDATSFRSNYGHPGISASGFAGTSNHHGFPGPAFGGFAVADSSGNNFYGGGNTYGGGYAHGYGDPNAFDAVSKVFQQTGMGAGFPFNMFGRRKR